MNIIKAILSGLATVSKKLRGYFVPTPLWIVTKYIHIVILKKVVVDSYNNRYAKGIVGFQNLTLKVTPIH